MNRSGRTTGYPIRAAVVLGFLFGGMTLLAARALWLQVVTSDYLQEQGNARHLRVVQDNSHRGMIFDRHGEPLAISTPVDSVWAEPGVLDEARTQWPALAKVLGISAREIAQAVHQYQGREFMYLKRHVTPEQAEQVKTLKIAGIGLTREYRRYYPSGTVAGHVVGFTDVDDQGLEGIEVHYSKHTPEQSLLYARIAGELDLAPSGGSDFHGAANPAIHLGRGFGSLCVPDEIVAGLEARRPRA